MPPGVAITRVGVGCERGFQRAPFVAAIGRLAVERVDLADAAAGEPLDLARQLDERHAERVGEHACPASTCRRRAGRSARCAVAPTAPPRRRTAPPARDARDAAPPRCVATAVRDQRGAPANRARHRRRSVRPADSRARRRPAAAPGSRRCRHPTRDWRGGARDTPAAVASALRVSPRRARSVRTRSPSAARNPAGSPASAGAVPRSRADATAADADARRCAGRRDAALSRGSAMKCSIVLDSSNKQALFCTSRRTS